MEKALYFLVAAQKILISPKFLRLEGTTLPPFPLAGTDMTIIDYNYAIISTNDSQSTIRGLFGVRGALSEAAKQNLISLTTLIA